MKKGILFILGMFMMVSTVEANDGNPKARKDLVWEHSNLGYNVLYRAKPIQFIEKGIKFYVYPNGQVDFNLNTRTRYTRNYDRRYDYNYRTSNRKRHVIYDRYGKVRRVKNVSITYNRFGKVSRIGSVYVDYHHRRIARIGGLVVRYNRFGDIKYIGSVKPRYRYNRYRYDAFYNGMILDYDHDYFLDDSFYNDFESYDEDQYYYYYKSKKHKGKKQGKVLKRKKGPSKKEDKKRR